MIEVILWIIYSLSSFGNFNGKMAKIHFLASQTWVFLVQAGHAQGGWLVFYQPFLYQLVPRIFKDVQAIMHDATLEKATLLFTVFCKTGLLLKDS